jgi:N-acetylglutamate synthase-like GNAT family acetyltransferase
MDREEITVKYLADVPEAIPVIARWLYDEFHYLIPERPIDYVIESLNTRLNYNKIPLSIIALKEHEIIGTVSLKMTDMDIRDNLTPWLASLFVNNEYRHNGVGTFLVKSVQEIAKQIGIKELFLYTPNSWDFYKKIGWTIIERLEYKSRDVVIMKYSL